MDIITTVIFLLDVLAYKDCLKRTLTNIQIKKIEKLIKVLYMKINNENKINENDYLSLYNIYKGKKISEQDKNKQNRIKEIVEDLKCFLETGNIKDVDVDSNDKLETSLNSAYSFIVETLKDSLKEIHEEQLTEKDIEKLKIDNSRNANVEIARLYVLSEKTKEEFCKKTFISQARLNKALNFVLKTEDKSLEKLKENILIREMELDEEVALVEKVMVNYDRKEKNISLIEFQSLTRLTISGMIKELKERESKAYYDLLELYHEYQNRLKLQLVYFEELRRTKNIINGRELVDADYDIIEDFLVENNYPEQRAIYAYVKDAYLNGTLESLERNNLKRKVLEKFNLLEYNKEKIHK